MDIFKGFAELWTAAGSFSASGLAIGGFILFVGRYAIYKPLKNLIISSTREIQPNANGGKSLADVAEKIGEIRGELRGLIDRIENIEKNVALLSKRRSRKEP
jgi:hypothetical protein